MFDFKLSDATTRRIVRNLEQAGLPLPAAYFLDIDSLCEIWGRKFVNNIAIFAHRKQHACRSAQASDVPATEFYLVKNAKFPKEIAERLGGSIPFLEGDVGDRLMAALAQEFLAWLKEHGSPKFKPQAPVEKIELRDEDAVVHVRPYVPPPVDPNWVQATVIK